MVQLQAGVEHIYIPCPSCGQPGFAHKMACPYSLASSGKLHVFLKEAHPKP